MQGETQITARVASLWWVSPACWGPPGAWPFWAQDTSTTPSSTFSASWTPHKVNMYLCSLVWTAFVSEGVWTVYMLSNWIRNRWTCWACPEAAFKPTFCVSLSRFLYLLMDLSVSQEAEEARNGGQDDFCYCQHLWIQIGLDPLSSLAFVWMIKPTLWL